MKKILRLLAFLLAGPALLPAQKPISLEDIWASNIFEVKTVDDLQFLNDGLHYARRNGNRIEQFDIAGGEKTATLFDP
ncbi:MAG: S9 family peptidase, partial [Saprospiraceae bacterium]|nr:S9 family peptidase [Saprospiraceae bacterium]